MGLFSKLFGKNEDLYLKKSLTLIKELNLYAIASYRPTTDQFYSLRLIKPEDWDTAVTIAMAFVALDRLEEKKVCRKTQNTVVNNVSKQLVELHPNAISRYQSCKTCFLKIINNQEMNEELLQTMGLALGTWVFLDTTKRTPTTEEEIQAVTVLGISIMQTGVQVWESK